MSKIMDDDEDYETRGYARQGWIILFVVACKDQLLNTSLPNIVDLGLPSLKLVLLEIMTLFLRTSRFSSH